mgnify:FL=1|jgi:hypothetical protein
MYKPLFSSLFLPLLLASCAFGYQARGSLSDVAGEMRGNAYPANSGGGRFLLMDTERRLTCDGQASPPKQSPNPGSCAGEVGQGQALCSDGREISFHWEAISCRAWKGSGFDAQGNRLEFRVERR